jgi:hypothetical protein
MDWSVQYIEHGREEGKVKLIKLVTKLLTRKFGPLPSDLELKIESTNSATLDRLAVELLDLDSLKELEDILK